MKFLKKSLSVLLALVMCVTCMSVCASAAWWNSKTMDAHIIVEGISKTLYDEWIEVSKTATVLEALTATGLSFETKETEYGLYVTSIEGDEEKTFGGWDGWIFELDGEICEESVDKARLSFDDGIYVVIFYYGDPYGSHGMQYPNVQQDIDGVITVTSEDTVKNWETGESVTTVNPVVGATVSFDDGTVVLITDSEGKVYIPEELKDGFHTYTIERYAEDGCPTVLRSTYEYGALGQPSVPIPDFIYKIILWFESVFAKLKEFFSGLNNK